jgi:hypothetical protein
MLAGHRHLDQPGARLAFDFAMRELRLRLLHALLHLLRLLHQPAIPPFIMICFLAARGLWTGWIVCGRTRASKSRIASRRTGRR